ncbi:MAG TPA: outer membrane beta-barrel protein [Roseomonas sp.]|jgi:hypothetical protein
MPRRQHSVRLACLAAFLAMASGGAAWAQSDAAAAQRGITVQTRPRPDFDPLGVRLGSFQLDASLESGVGYDDNLLGTERNRRGDTFIGTTLAAGLRSQWTTHALGLSARVDDTHYLQHSALNWRDWSVEGFGRYDVDAVSSLDMRVTHRRAHIAVQSIDAQQAGLTTPLEYDEDIVRIGASTRINRLALTGYGQGRWVRFDADSGRDNDPSLAADYDAWSGGATAAYELSPGRAATLTVRAEDQRGHGRFASDTNSFTYEVLGGFAYDFDGVYQAAVGVGYARRSYDNGGRRDLSGLGIDARLIYAPSQLTTLTFGVRRGIDDSVRAGGQSFLRTLVSARVDHEIQRNVIAGFEVSYDRREYRDPSQRATDLVGILSVQWLLNRNMALIASYQHAVRFGVTAGIEEYNQNVIQLRLRVSL